MKNDISMSMGRGCAATCVLFSSAHRVPEGEEGQAPRRKNAQNTVVICTKECTLAFVHHFVGLNSASKMLVLVCLCAYLMRPAFIVGILLPTHLLNSWDTLISS